MKNFNKRKASKITYKSHHKHKPLIKKGRIRSMVERYTAL